MCCHPSCLATPGLCHIPTVEGDPMKEMRCCRAKEMLCSLCPALLGNELVKSAPAAYGEGSGAHYGVKLRVFCLEKMWFRGTLSLFTATG